MSIGHVKMALEAKISVSLKLILIILCEAANKEGYCWPSLRVISDRAGLCERSVQRDMAALEQAGLIRRVPRRRDDGSSTSNGYYVFPTAISASSATNNPADSERQMSGGGDTGATPLTTIEINLIDGSDGYKDSVVSQKLESDQLKTLNACAEIRKNNISVSPVAKEFAAAYVEKMRKALAIRKL